MRRALILSLLAFAVVRGSVDASEIRVSIVQGANIRTFTGVQGGKYSIQCPNIDGGAGQRVYYRPGCPTKTDGGVMCVVDAGQGDVILDFTAATGVQDPYKIDLGANEDRIHLGNADSYAAAVWCSIYRRSP